MLPALSPFVPMTETASWFGHFSFLGNKLASQLLIFWPAMCLSFSKSNLCLTFDKYVTSKYSSQDYLFSQEHNWLPKPAIFIWCCRTWTYSGALDFSKDYQLCRITSHSFRYAWFKTEVICYLLFLGNVEIISVIPAQLILTVVKTSQKQTFLTFSYTATLAYMFS